MKDLIIYDKTKDNKILCIISDINEQNHDVILNNELGYALVDNIDNCIIGNEITGDIKYKKPEVKSNILYFEDYKKRV